MFNATSYIGDTNSGFCGREGMMSTTATTGLVQIGYKSSATDLQAYKFMITGNHAEVTTTTSWNKLDNLQRVLIVPNKITYFNNISNYNKA